MDNASQDRHDNDEPNKQKKKNETPISALLVAGFFLFKPERPGVAAPS